MRRRRKLPPGDVEGGELEAPEEAGGFGFAASARLLLDELAAVARPPKLNRLHGKENRRVRCGPTEAAGEVGSSSVETLGERAANG